MPWTIDQLLDDPDASSLLESYMRNVGDEDENFYFWRAVRQYRHDPTADGARDIVRTYVDRAARVPINIPSSEINRVIREVNVRGFVADGTEFDEAYRWTQQNLDRQYAQGQGSPGGKSFFTSRLGASYAGDHSAQLDAILDDPRDKTADFYAFASREQPGRAQAVDFLLAVAAYARTLDRSRAQAIFDGYLGANADAGHRVVIPDAERQGIAAALQRSPLSPDLFNGATALAKASLDGLVIDYMHQRAERGLQRAAGAAQRARAAAGGDRAAAPAPDLDQMGDELAEPGEAEDRSGDLVMPAAGRDDGDPGGDPAAPGGEQDEGRADGGPEPGEEEEGEPARPAARRGEE